LQFSWEESCSVPAIQRLTRCLSPACGSCSDYLIKGVLISTGWFSDDFSLPNLFWREVRISPACGKLFSLLTFNEKNL
jgi:hypothetical protein